MRPTTAAQFLELVKKSELLEPERLDAYVAEKSNLPDEARVLAAQFARDGLLTFYQARRLLSGRHSGFFFGKYKILERLDSIGPAGSFFLSEHLYMKRRVAIKFLPVDKMNDPGAVKRFYREARASAALDHPNIIRTFDMDRVGDLHFLVMEFLDGVNLQDLVSKKGPLELTRAAHYVRQAAVGLQYLHKSGLIHRDIKPSNFLLDRKGTIKLLDLGLVRFFNDDQDQLTQQHKGTVLELVDYLAPEQLLDLHTVDVRADIYSLGATFFYLLTGKSPLQAGNLAQKIRWIQTQQLRDLKELRPELPDNLVSIVQRMMTKNAAERYSSAIAVAVALAPWTSKPLPPPPADEMPQLSPALLTMEGEGQEGQEGAEAESAATKPAPAAIKLSAEEKPASEEEAGLENEMAEELGLSKPTEKTVENEEQEHPAQADDEANADDSAEDQEAPAESSESAEDGAESADTAEAAGAEETVAEPKPGFWARLLAWFGIGRKQAGTEPADREQAEGKAEDSPDQEESEPVAAAQPKAAPPETQAKPTAGTEKKEPKHKGGKGGKRAGSRGRK